MSFQVGDRVRHSGYAIMPLRDWHGQQGEHRAKQRAKDALDKALAERGTITAILHNGVEVTWDSGSTCQCLSYRVEKV